MVLRSKGKLLLPYTQKQRALALMFLVSFIGLLCSTGILIWTFNRLCRSRKWQAVSLGLVAGFIFVAVPVTAVASEPPPAFRILNVKAEYGHVVVEIEHMNPDGSRDYMENYVVRGKEWWIRPWARNEHGQALLSNGSVAPYRISPTALENGRGLIEQYAPVGMSWQYSSIPRLDINDIAQIAARTHTQRSDTGWGRGDLRLLTAPLDYTVGDLDGLDDYGPNDEDGAHSLAALFQGHIGEAYSIVNNLPVRYWNVLDPADMRIGEELGTVSLFYPNANPESTSVDGTVQRAGVNEVWSTIRAGAGTTVDANSATDTGPGISTSGTTNQWSTMRRAIFLFDTSTLNDGAVISEAEFSLVCTDAYNTLSSAQSVALVTSSPASDTALATGDFSNFTTIRQSDTDRSLSDIDGDTNNCDGTTYLTGDAFALNSTGRGNVQVAGITKFGTRFASDIDNSAPTWASGKDAYLTQRMAEYSGGAYAPRLSVTYTIPTTAVTGTIGDGATEQEVRDGGGTVLLTLTDTTWVAAGATFNAQRQNIIDGLDSAESETYGWNAEVRDEMAVGSVVRTSDTLVTITVDADDVGGYRITSSETITATVPSTATAAGAAMTASPTFTISAASETAAVTGTLSDGGTSPEIIAGGETVIITLTNTKWVTAGSDFNAQRQNIIDGMVSASSGNTGWNDSRSSFAVTDVVRTSDTQVTITLTAAASYAILSTETITLTVPASAILYGAALTGSPTFAISPSFVSSGTWVSPAVDLSSITDLSYCAIGWSTTLPAGTAATVEYSTDGGDNYSTATNGECPFTLRTNISGTTDFRLKASLSRTLATTTPQVDALGVVFGDAAGQTVRYQLNDLPGLTVTDRTGNGYTGTMSFPSQVSGVTTTVGSMSALRDPPSAQKALGFPQITSPVTGSAVSDNLFNLDETGWAALPGYDIVNSMATAGDGLPIQFVWYIFLGFIIIMAGFFALNLTQSLFAAGAAMALGVGAAIAIGGGLMPGWIIFIYIPVAIGLVLLRPRLAI